MFAFMSNMKTIRLVFWIAFVLLTIEALAQIRAYIHYGSSPLSSLFSESPYYFDEELSVRRFKPNMTIKGDQNLIKTNSLGFRSDELDISRENNEARIIVLGASTVMGAYAKNNSETFSGILQSELRNRFSDMRINVLNAGLQGLSIFNQIQLFKKELLPLKPDYLILYSGMNHLANLCRKSGANAKKKEEGVQIPMLKIPKWWLTYELLVKNTIWVRQKHLSLEKKGSNTANKTDIEPDLQFLLKEYDQALSDLYGLVKDNGIELILLGPSRAYRPEMTESEQWDLSETARFYNNCLTVQQLNEMYHLFNTKLALFAKKNDVLYLDTNKILPGGKNFYVDSTHFSLKAEHMVANALFNLFVSIW